MKISQIKHTKFLYILFTNEKYIEFVSLEKRTNLRSTNVANILSFEKKYVSSRIVFGNCASNMFLEERYDNIFIQNLEIIFRGKTWS